VLGAWLNFSFFGVPMAAVFHQSAADFLLSVICANSMALTSWTPTGALSKITQITWVRSTPSTRPAT
jgi:hypothetical protein